MSGFVRVMDQEADDLTAAAVELDKWLVFAGCEHLGYISVGIEEQGAPLSLFVYWDETRMAPGGMLGTMNGFPVKLKRIGRPTPATS